MTPEEFNAWCAEIDLTEDENKLFEMRKRWYPVADADGWDLEPQTPGEAELVRRSIRRTNELRERRRGFRINSVEVQQDPQDPTVVNIKANVTHLTPVSYIKATFKI